MPAFASKLTPEQRWNVVMYLGSLHHAPQQIVEGEGLYFQNCTSCHGPAGMVLSAAVSVVVLTVSSSPHRLPRHTLFALDKNL